MPDSKYYPSQYSNEYTRSTQAVSSRRAKSEQSKLLKQTLMLFGGAVLFLLLSFFIIIPRLIQFISGFSSSTSIAQDNSLPPQTPSLSVPASATPSAMITLQGFTSKNVEVVLLKNEKEEKKVNSDDTGKFSIPVSLTKGKNSFLLYATNGKKESAKSQEYTTIFDNEPPSLEVMEPQDGQTIEGKRNQNVTLKGKTDEHTRVQLNDRNIFVQADGTFSSSFRLEPGQNVLNFVAIDQAGNKTEKKITVTFNE